MTTATLTGRQIAAFRRHQVNDHQLDAAADTSANRRAAAHRAATRRLDWSAIAKALGRRSHQ